MTVLVPLQQLPADVTDSEHWTTFLSAAHEHRFDGLRGERVVSGTKWHHPAPRLLADTRLVLLGTTGTELDHLFESAEEQWSDIVAKVMRGQRARASARHGCVHRISYTPSCIVQHSTSRHTLLPRLRGRAER